MAKNSGGTYGTQGVMVNNGSNGNHWFSYFTVINGTLLKQKTSNLMIGGQQDFTQTNANPGAMKDFMTDIENVN